MENKYPTKVFWNVDDNCFIAIVPNIDAFEGISAFGDTQEEALKELRVAIRGALKSMKKNGWDIPESVVYKDGKFQSEKAKQTA